MRRRELLVVLGIALPSVTARGQAHRVQRVAVLFPAGAEPGLRQLVEALAKLGYEEGRNIAYEARAADGQPERLSHLARELVAMNPEVIVSATSSAARALTDATRDIPIILALISEPVALGLSRSIARPTGNVTGFMTGHDTVAGKRLQLLHELVPTARKVALLWVPENVQHRIIVELTHRAAAALGVELLSVPITNAEDISLAIARIEGRASGRASGSCRSANPQEPPHHH